ncbi:autotransporter domain-containing protein [Aquabacter sp. CN5-332]|uniref:autotransporter domain-containing protein n=1 Tax=Aquabacter sp. CN5-332 TaxID=3156608 RepID=UPI0032B3ECB5
MSILSTYAPVALGMAGALRRWLLSSSSLRGARLIAPAGLARTAALLAMASAGILALSTPPAAADEIIDNGQVVTVPGDHTSPWSTGNLTVGGQGSGTLTIEANGTVTSTTSYIGLNAGSTGTVTVTGENAHWNLGTSDLELGFFSGNGTLTIEAGGTVTSGTGLIGDGAGSVGTVTVTGENANWNLGSSSLYVGVLGGGTFTIEAGGTVTSRSSSIGANTGSTGTVTVTGEDATWNLQGSDLSVGNLGIGTVTIEAGGMVTSANGYIGRMAGSTGTVTVTGADANWNLGSSMLYVGGHGNGTLTIEAGGTVTSGNSIIGDADGSVGTVTVTGANAHWNLGTSQLQVGILGNSTLTIEAGGMVTSGNGYIGTGSSVAGPTGTVTVTGADARWNLGSSTLQVGVWGNGTLTIEAGGTVTSGTGFVANAAHSTGMVTVTGGDAHLNLGPEFFVGHLGTGTLIIEAGGTVTSGIGYIGYFASGIGTVTVTGEDTQWNLGTSDLYVTYWGPGTLTIEAGGTVTSGDSYIGYAAGVPDSAGTVTVRGENANWNLESSNLYVGDGGTGTLTIEAGGTVTSATSFVGHDGGSGTLNLNGTADDGRGVLATSQIVKGPGTAALNFDGGVLRATAGQSDFLSNFAPGDIEIRAGGAFIDSNGFDIGISAVLEGAGGLTKQGEGTLTLWQSGGIAGAVSIEAGTLALSGSASLAGASGVFLGGSARLDVSTITAATTITNLSGASSTAEVVLGSKALTISQSADATFAGAFSGSGSLTKQGGGALTLSGDSSGFSGTTTISAGSLLLRNGATTVAQLGGTVTVAEGGTLGGSGTLTGAVSVEEGGTLSAGSSPGTLTFTNNLTLNAGSTTVFELATPGVVGGAGNDYIDVGGTLTIAAGAGLEIQVGAAGYYTLFGYGTLAGTSFAATVTGTGGFDLDRSSIDYGSGTGGAITLIALGEGQTIQYWDGATQGSGGGAGTWNATNPNWADAPQAPAGYGPWLGSVGVFGGTSGGTVTVSGTRSFDTLQFITDGYQLVGGTLAMNPVSGASGTINVDANVSATIHSVIADGAAPAGLVKLGAGQLRLTGMNTYTGGTTIGGGTLQVAADANLGAASGGLTFNGGTLSTTASFSSARDVTVSAASAIEVADDTGLDLSGAIAGPGILAKQGLGTLTLTGTSSVAWNIEAGRLIADAAGFTGDATIAAGAGLGFNQAADTTYAGTISGAGSLTKLGAGTLILTGTNAYTGGTVLADGIVKVSADANLGAASGGLTFAGGMLVTTSSLASARAISVPATGGFDVASGTTLDLSGTISGPGSLVKLGTGTLALAGTSSVGWTVQAGSLTARAASFSGDVTISAAAAFALNAGMAAGYAGTLSGTGSFTKTGPASLNYTGNGAAFTGLTSVAAGRLAVNGTLGGPVSVLSGATLGGSGTTGPVTLANGAVIAPGNSIGTLTVNGDITFAAGSTYQAELAGSGASDLIISSGRAVLNGADLALVALDPGVSYQNGQSFMILDAGGGVVGSFGSVATGSVFLTARTSELDGAVMVSVTVADDGPNPPTPPAVFTSAAITPNQYATAAALDTLGQSGASQALYNAILFLPSAEAARGAFDQLSGEVHASAQSVFMEQSSLIRGALTDRLRAAQGGVGASTGPVVSYEGGTFARGYAAPSPVQVAADVAMPAKAVAAPATTEKFALWTTGFGNWGEFGGNGNAASLSDSTGGFLIGADASIGDGWRLGVAGGYSYSAFSIAGRNSSGTSDNWHVGVYGGKVWGLLAVRTGLAYSRQDVTTGRSVAFTGFAGTLNADYDVGTFQAFGELGWRIDAAFASFEPFANLAYVSLDTGAYQEQDGAAVLFSGGSDMYTIFSTLGLRMSKGIVLGSTDATLRGAIGWRHAFGDITPTISQAFVSSDAFTVTGVPIAEDAAVLEAGFDVRVGGSTTLGVAYTGQFGGDVTQNGFNATLKVSF